MFKLRIQYEGRRVTIKSFGIRPLQMLRLGSFGLKQVKARVAQGIGLDDAPMPPLKRAWVRRGVKGKYVIIAGARGYFARKLRRGGKPIRDLRFTGAMLDNLSVRSATANEVRIGFTTKLAREKALANQRIAPWLGWSDTDAPAVQERARLVLRQEIQSVYFPELKRRFRRAA